MIVVGFKTLDSFLDELREEQSRIADRTVRVDFMRTPEQAEQVTFANEAWITAVSSGTDADYLLEANFFCGVDDTSSGNLGGTAMVEQVRRKLTEACDDLGLKVRPGRIEVF